MGHDSDGDQVMKEQKQKNNDQPLEKKLWAAADKREIVAREIIFQKRLDFSRLIYYIFIRFTNNLSYNF